MKLHTFTRVQSHCGSKQLTTACACPRYDHRLLAAHAGYRFYGLNRGEHEGKTGIWYREWAPGARVRYLILKNTCSRHLSQTAKQLAAFM